MLTFRFLHRVTLKIIATFLALTAAQAAEVVNLGVQITTTSSSPYSCRLTKVIFRDEGIELRLHQEYTGTSLSLAGTLGRAKARPTSVR